MQHDKAMSEFHKYSIAPNMEVITFLVNNGIEFAFVNDAQKNRMRVFFIATDEIANTIHEFTGWHCVDESDGWSFDKWNTFSKFNLL